MGKKKAKKAKSSSSGSHGHGHHMSKKKKVLIGAGVAAVAVAGIGGLCVGKVLYDRHKKNAAKGGKGGPPGSFSTREVLDDGPQNDSPHLAPYRQPHPKTFTNTAPIPDAVAIGLSYDEDTGAKMNLLAACFDSYGNNLGYLQSGGQLTSLFNKAAQHTGDTHASTFGDHENIIFDLRQIPGNCSQILFGSYLVQPPSNGLPKAYIHMLPMLRTEHIDNQEASGATKTIDYDSEEEDQHNSASSGQDVDDNDEDDFVRLYQDDLDNTQFGSLKGFVGAKIFRDLNTGAWYITPYRTPVNADAQFGLWPALEHYAKPV